MKQNSFQLKKRQPVPACSRRASWLGYLAGLLSSLSGRSRLRIGGKDLQRHDFSTSTQRLGVRFNERIRDTFRFRWLGRL